MINPNKTIAIEVSSNEVSLQASWFNIPQIINSGQCFRNSTLSSDSWLFFCGKDKVVVLRQDDKYIFQCSLQEFKNIWSTYFDLDTDYIKITNEINQINDIFLINAIRYCFGLRILKQDFWETVISFIISQQNNIPRIRNTINTICNYYGGGFPTPQELLACPSNVLDSFKLGYRQKYIVSACELFASSPTLSQKLISLEYINLIKYLSKINGIGPKVANCIALFGAHKLEAFPVDVWIKKILDKYYPNGAPFIGSKYAGYIQQCLFVYERYLQQKTTDF